jgi:membrane-bound lytic murein transglycosylase B
MKHFRLSQRLKRRLPVYFLVLGVAVVGFSGGALVAKLSHPERAVSAEKETGAAGPILASGTSQTVEPDFSAPHTPAVEPEKTGVPGLPESVTDPAEVEQAADNAARLTGVRKEFLLGMMAVETVIGENMGRCTYKQVSDGAEAAHASGALSSQAWATFQKQRELIRGLAHDLSYDADRLKVSCNPAASEYAGTGGAMGISQFMPTTWYEYEDRLKALSGKEHPDPWNVDDGILAMALKLSDVPGVTDHNLAAEKRASKLYLSGSSSSQYEWYADDVQYWSKNHNDILGDQYTLSLLMESLQQ